MSPKRKPKLLLLQKTTCSRFLQSNSFERYFTPPQHALLYRRNLTDEIPVLPSKRVLCYLI